MKTLSSLSPCRGGVVGIRRAASRGRRPADRGRIGERKGLLARRRRAGHSLVSRNTSPRRPGVAVAALWFPAATEGRAEVTWGRGAGAEQRMFQVQPRGIGIGGTACP
jgi:hypothetical protein